jgi:hypothetical protein
MRFFRGIQDAFDRHRVDAATAHTSRVCVENILVFLSSTGARTI